MSEASPAKAYALHLGVIALLFVLSFLLPEYYHGLLARIMVLAVFAMGYNMLFGYVGYSAGLHLRPFELGFHVSIQALTKFQSGGADVVMGSVASVREDICRSLHETRHFLGMHVSPDDIYLVLRGLPTLGLRYTANTEASLRLAKWFSEKKEIAAVMHPAFAQSEGHAYWKQYFTASTSLFSIAFRSSVEAEKTEAFLEALTLFHFGFSWGGPASLVMLYDKEGAPARQFANAHPDAGCIVRFWLGLEDGADLETDIFNAWSSVFDA